MNRRQLLMLAPAALTVGAMGLATGRAIACERRAMPRWTGMIQQRVSWSGEVAPGVPGHQVERFWVDQHGDEHPLHTLYSDIKRVPGFVPEGRVEWLEDPTRPLETKPWSYFTPEFPYLRHTRRRPDPHR